MISKGFCLALFTFCGALQLHAVRVLVVDANAPEYEAQGQWQTSSKVSGHDGSATEFSNTDGASVRWGTGGRVQGRARVWFFKVRSAEFRPTKVELSVISAGEVFRKVVDLSDGESEWIELGTFPFAGKTGEGVQMAGLADFMAGAVVRADAVKYEALEKEILPLESKPVLDVKPTSKTEAASGPGAAGKSFSTVLTYDPTTVRSMEMAGQKTKQMERERYFRIFFPPGHETAEMTELYRSLRISGARACLSLSSGYKPAVQDPLRPGYVDPAWVKGAMPKFKGWYQKAAQEWPGVVHAMALSEEPSWLMKHGYPVTDSVETYEAMADLVWQWYTQLREASLPYPQYFSSQNEPSWKFAGRELGRYTAVMAKRLAADFPDVRVCGPCPAWPYPHLPEGKWTRWNSNEKAFIDEAGGVIDGYDFHFYSKGYWAYTGEKPAPTPSLMEAQWHGVDTVWDYGRVDAFLDLVAAYHLATWGGEARPVLITEFGHQGIDKQFGPWENEFKPWLYMTTVTRLWMRFFERPEVVMTVPFILGDASTTPRGMALKNKDGMTRFRDFYAFFSDLDGERLPVQISDAQLSDARYLVARAFRKENSVYLLLHNGIGYPLGCEAWIRLTAAVPGVVPKAAGVKRMKWTGPVPDPHNQPDPEGRLIIDTGYQPLDPEEPLRMAGEETCLVRLDFETLPAASGQQTERIFFCSRTVVSVPAGREERFEVELPVAAGTVRGALLGLGLFRDGGLDVNPEIRVNGKELSGFDMTWSKGIRQHHTLEELEVPAGLLRVGVNEIRIALPAGQKELLVSSVRLKIIQ